MSTEKTSHSDASTGEEILRSIQRECQKAFGPGVNVTLDLSDPPSPNGVIKSKFTFIPRKRVETTDPSDQ